MTYGNLNDSNKRELSSRFSFFAVREEEVMMTAGAEIDPIDLSFWNPFFFHLVDIDLGKVHPPLPPPARSRKELPLREEGPLIDLIAARPYRWTQGDKEILRRTEEFLLHFSQNLRRDVEGCSLPSSMDRTKHSPFLIDHKDREAIRSEDTEESVRRICNQGIIF